MTVTWDREKIDQWLTGASLVTTPETIPGRISGPGARFSKVPIINGPVKLSLFTRKIEVSIVFASNMIKLSVNETKWSS